MHYEKHLADLFQFKTIFKLSNFLPCLCGWGSTLSTVFTFLNNRRDGRITLKLTLEKYIEKM